MGWCSGTEVFDSICEDLLDKDDINIENILYNLINTLDYMDWDCHNESAFWEHPIVQKIMRDLHPDWFEDEDKEVKEYELALQAERRMDCYGGDTCDEIIPEWDAYAN